MELIKLQEAINAVRAKRGFVTDPLKIHLLLSEELGEVAAELKRLWSDNYDAFSKDRLADELADMLVLLTALANEYAIDLEAAVVDKFFKRDSQRNWQSASRETKEVEMTEERIMVGKLADFEENSMTPFEIAGHDVLVIYQEGRFYALEDRCTHDNGILHDGELLDGAVKCERHGAKFNLETGKPTLPAIKKIRLYQTEVLDDAVYVHYQEA